MLTLEVQNHSQITVLRCLGRIVHGDGADALLRAVMSQEKRYLQIDLGGVEAIDASGLGTLVALQKWAAESNRSLQLLNPSKRVREAIETTHLISVLQFGPAQRACTDAA